MTESQVVSEWISAGEIRGELKKARENLLQVLQFRFPNAVPEEVVKLINRQDSEPLLNDWFASALRASTFEQFLEVLKR